MTDTSKTIARDLLIAAIANKQIGLSGRPIESAEQLGNAYRTLVLAIEEADQAVREGRSNLHGSSPSSETGASFDPYGQR